VLQHGGLARLRSVARLFVRHRSTSAQVQNDGHVFLKIIVVVLSPKQNPIITNLVGRFTTSEKYLSVGMIIPNI
jgi:hypothetical protein